MKKIYFPAFAIFFGVYSSSAQKVLYNCTVTYDVRVMDSTAPADVVQSVSKAVKTSYISNNSSRNDYVAPNFKETAIFKDKCDTITVLKETPQAKYISYIETAKFGEEVKNNSGVRFMSTREHRNILGYECKLVHAQFPDGSVFKVFYTPLIQPSNKAFEQQFKELPGLVLEYEEISKHENTRVKYTAVALDVSPVPEQMFKVPDSGYTVL